MNNNYKIKIKKGEIEFEVEGDKEFVKELFEEFKTEMENIPEPKMKPIKGEKDQTQLLSNKYSIQRLYKIFNPKTNLERILIFAYYMLKVEKIEEFSTKEIIKYFVQFKIKKPAYISRDFRSLSNLSKGDLIPASNDGYFSLSYDAIQDIEEKLNKLGIE